MLIWSDEEKRFKATYHRVTTRDDVASRGAREYHRQVANLAIDSIESQTPEEREFQSFALNVPQKKIRVLKEMMRKFRSQVEAELRDDSDVAEFEPEELYQMNLQFFRLTDEPCAKVRKEHVDTGASETNAAELAAEIGNI